LAVPIDTALYELEAKGLRYPLASPPAVRRAGPDSKPMVGKHSLDANNFMPLVLIAKKSN